jgi:4a-hydroxytetrahydrobiopterin dehydratase
MGRIMPTVSKLSAEQCLSRLQQINKDLALPWQINGDSKLVKTVRFDDFIQAWAFMSKVALYAEKNQHHPEWSNVYNTVSIELTTHDVAGLSDKDFAFASFVEKSCLI